MVGWRPRDPMPLSRISGGIEGPLGPPEAVAGVG